MLRNMRICNGLFRRNRTTQIPFDASRQNTDFTRSCEGGFNAVRTLHEVLARPVSELTMHQVVTCTPPHHPRAYLVVINKYQHSHSPQLNATGSLLIEEVECAVCGAVLRVNLIGTRNVVSTSRYELRPP
uniref:Uncharacterized protein n=1 Tax=Mesocestoides corti TaxID=53468 RepID=A0A5K3G1D5_MESCO